MINGFKSKLNIITGLFKSKGHCILTKVKALKMDFILSYALFNLARSIVKGKGKITFTYSAPLIHFLLKILLYHIITFNI